MTWACVQEYSALVHRRKMLLRVAECASILLGRGVSDGADAARPSQNLQELSDWQKDFLPKFRNLLEPLEFPLPEPIALEIRKSVAFIRSATRALSENI
jgi:hypothetical protein